MKPSMGLKETSTWANFYMFLKTANLGFIPWRTGFLLTCFICFNLTKTSEQHTAVQDKAKVMRSWNQLFYKTLIYLLFNSVQSSHSVMSNSLGPHELQYARPPCPSLTPGVHPNPCPLSWWCHPTISSSVIPFTSCPQSLPASGSFPMNQLFTSGEQSIGDSASTSVLQMNSQDWSPLGWTGWISLQSKGLSRVFFNTIVQKHQFFSSQLSL